MEEGGTLRSTSPSVEGCGVSEREVRGRGDAREVTQRTKDEGITASFDLGLCSDIDSDKKERQEKNSAEIDTVLEPVQRSSKF